MTREKTAELLPLMQAYAAGETIQRATMQGQWVDDYDPRWDLPPECYRVKARPPKPLEWWLGRCSRSPQEAVHAFDNVATARIVGNKDNEIIHVREVITQ